MSSCATEPLAQEKQKMQIDTMTFLALGDSYTIGESVATDERWPVLLQSMFENDTSKVRLSDPKIIATTGWTTDELQKAIISANISEQSFDLVSLLIGVNNQYRGYPLSQYEEEFEDLLNQAIDFASGDSNKVFVVSIPDYGVTPFAQNRNPETIAQEIDIYTDVAKSICANYKVDFLDITPISREAVSNPALVAEDQLHPSGAMYRKWVERVIYPVVIKKIQ